MHLRPDNEKSHLDDRIYLVVPVFNRRSLTERFLSCLRFQSFRNFETIVVDDGSTDDTAELIAKNFPEVQLQRGDGNLWWTGAVNVGIRHAIAQATATAAILVINNDVEISANYLEIIHGLWQSLPRTLIGSVAVAIDNRDIIVDGGTIVNWWTAKTTKLNPGRRLSEIERDSYDVSVLTGRGTLIPIEVFRDVGLYNDKHYQQSGDEELPARAARAGYRLIIDYRCIVRTLLKSSYAVNVADRYSIRDIKKYFFDIRSNARLKSCFFFAYDTAINPVAFISFLLCQQARVTGHFIRRLRLWRPGLPCA
jgi:GT2 family glycosyltransferase